MYNTDDLYRYSSMAHERKHGPEGYADYDSYREWLRDEFAFRCVFCLRRELWVGRTANFHVDHWQPQVAGTEETNSYVNLLYVCSACNALKGSHVVASPDRIPFGSCLRVNEDGTIEALNSDGESLIKRLRLDNADHTGFRRRRLADLQACLDAGDRDGILRICGFPDDLPDLRRKVPPGGNSRKSGLETCCFVLRERGELPEMY